MDVIERSWPAMGSQAHLIVVDGSLADAERAIARTAQLEARWSRFVPTSEVSTLARLAGTPVEVSADTRRLADAARTAWRDTAGLVDATVLGAVVAAGYDRSLAASPYTGSPVDVASTEMPLPRVARWLVGCDDIEVTSTTVTLPAGTGFDPGGIGKGLAADIVLGELLHAGVAGACVNLGGDLRVAGIAPHGTWTVEIEHPDEPRCIARIGLAAGAVATSTTRRRRWLVGGDERHHLIDPFTGRPTTSDLVQVSVIAPTAVAAEAYAKAALLRGACRAFDQLPVGTEAFAVDADGAVHTTPGWVRFGTAPLALELAA